MAANPRGLAALATILGHRFTNISAPAVAGATAFRKSFHVSTYDKNVDEHVRPVVVPDDAIDIATKADKFWGPHPTTGVFGPLDENSKAAFFGGRRSGNGEPSVLDQTAWFRPLENVDKPTHFE